LRLYSRERNQADDPEIIGKHRMIFKRSKPSANGSDSAHSSGPSIISQDMTIEGNITTNGELHIDGTVYGSIRAHSCVIDLNGFVQGDIMAEDLFVRGRVIGPIRGSNVNIYSGAQVEGDILNETISIENGANIYGMVSRMESPMADFLAESTPDEEKKLFPSAGLTFNKDLGATDKTEPGPPPKTMKPL
jgi:cytoskeletal protein CcmA (bactofilin family)